MNDYPTFGEAIEQFRAFAASQKVPSELLFLKVDDVVVSGDCATIRRPPERERRDEARTKYENAVRQRWGVELKGIISCEQFLGCYVYSPASDEESIERLMPDGLKLSILTPLLKGVFGARLLWAMLRWRERGHPTSVERKAFLFGHAG